MNTVNVEKGKLLDILRTNRDNHRDIFLEAQDKFRARVIEEFDRRLADARAGRKIDLYIGLPIPEDHTADYDRVIRMLEITTDEVIGLTEKDAAQYVMDQWAWRTSYANSTAIYTASAADYGVDQQF